MGAYRSAEPLPPPQPERNRRKRQRRAPPPAPSGSPRLALLLLAALILVGHAWQNREGAPLTRPMGAQGAALPKVNAAMQELLPPGAQVTQVLTLGSGDLALAWHDGTAAQVGVATPLPGGAYQLWTATTPERGDAAERSEVQLLRLPGLKQDVLVASYATEGCCAWVNLFALGPAPRLLFASPTNSARLLGNRILVRRLLPGTYPDGPAADVDQYTWDGQQFTLSGTTLAPQHYFPLAEGLRWTYETPDGLLERWVQGHQEHTTGDQYRVRSAKSQGKRLAPVPDSIYSYTPDGEVGQREPQQMLLLPETPALGSRWQPTANERAEVVEVLESLKVPAGTFTDVLVVVQGETRRYYAPHVGLIREEYQGKMLLALRSFHRRE